MFFVEYLTVTFTYQHIELPAMGNFSCVPIPIEYHPIHFTFSTWSIIIPKKLIHECLVLCLVIPWRGKPVSHVFLKKRTELLPGISLTNFQYIINRLRFFFIFSTRFEIIHCLRHPFEFFSIFTSNYLEKGGNMPGLSHNFLYWQFHPVHNPYVDLIIHFSFI